ncbi:MAG: hypothetical protein IJG38_02105 [Thermoguttaceae bacterium]|nr:hypothetical protein [Thermoguttaceae bacterium]
MEIMGFNIKTRARWKAKSTSGHWCFGGLGQDKYGNYGAMWELVEGFGQSFISIDPKTICMSTGVKDLSGNLIFENDYLSIDGAWLTEKIVCEKALVWYDEYYLTYYVQLNDHSELLNELVSEGNEHSWKIQVIGNKFDEE